MDATTTTPQMSTTKGDANTNAKSQATTLTLTPATFGAVAAALLSHTESQRESLVRCAARQYMALPATDRDKLYTAWIKKQKSEARAALVSAGLVSAAVAAEYAKANTEHRTAMRDAGAKAWTRLHDVDNLVGNLTTRAKAIRAAYATGKPTGKDATWAKDVTAETFRADVDAFMRAKSGKNACKLSSALYKLAQGEKPEPTKDAAGYKSELAALFAKALAAGLTPAEINDTLEAAVKGAATADVPAETIVLEPVEA